MKKEKVVDVANKLLSKTSLTFRDLTTYLGKHEAALPVIEYGRL